MKRTLFALALAAALPMSAQAAERSYSYVELDYVNVEIDLGSSLNANIDGAALRGSVEFADSGFYGFGSYADVEDLTQTDLGLGYAHNLSDNLDLVAELAWRNTDIGSIDADDTRVSVGLRGNLADNFEGTIKANYVDGDAYDGEFGGTIGGQFKFNDTWGITGEAEFVNDVTIYSVGVRASF
jgi:hypothetical protein